MVSVVIFQTIDVHYRAHLWRALENRYNLALFLGSEDAKDDQTHPKRYIKGRFESKKVTFLGLNIQWRQGMGKVLKSLPELPDIVICEGAPGIISNLWLFLWCRLRRIPLVAWVCGYEEDRNALQKIIRSIYLKMYWRIFDAFIAYSSSAADYLKSFGLLPERVFIAQNTVDTTSMGRRWSQVISLAKTWRISHINPDDIVFLYVGRMIKGKNVTLLVDAFGNLDPEKASLVLVGNGPEREKVENAISRLSPKHKGKIFVLGEVVENVDMYFAACDVFVLPGLGGLAINQAMFWGKPVICTQADGTEQDLVIEGETGFNLGKEADSSQLYMAMARFCQDTELYKTMGKAAKEHIAKIALSEHMVSGFERAILYATGKIANS